jgi:hypothetical protein
MLARFQRTRGSAMARGRKKSRTSTLEFVPDAWERFEKFLKSIVARPSGSKSRIKAKRRPRKTAGRSRKK